jgi:hypothetical protein
MAQKIKKENRMVSITRENNGRKTIQFVGADSKRRSIRLGKASVRTAEAVKVKVEQLAAAAMTGHALDAETAHWLSNLDSVMSDKLSVVGLIPRRESATLQEFIDGYISKRTDVKGSTATVYGHTRRNLIEFFGSDKPLRDITLGDADEWRLFVIEQPLSENTVRRRCGIAKQYFTVALRKGLVSQNPFDDLKAAVQANVSRFYFVSHTEAEKVIEACF